MYAVLIVNVSYMLRSIGMYTTKQNGKGLELTITLSLYIDNINNPFDIPRWGGPPCHNGICVGNNSWWCTFTCNIVQQSLEKTIHKKLEIDITFQENVIP